jgi:Transcriptional regulator
MRPLPTLRQLRYLVAVAEKGHFGRAAEECHVSQSTLSAGIQELEVVLGVRLIDRSHRQVMLTPLAEDIVLRARSLLQAAEELVDAAESGKQPLAGLLRLGVIPTIAPYLLPQALKRLRAAFPRLRLYLREDQSARLLDMLARGKLDAAIIALPYETMGLETLILGVDRMYLACRTDHRFAERSSIDPEDLSGERMLLLEDGHCLREHALTACRLAPGRSNEDLQGTSLATLVQMVVSGLGVTLLPEMAVSVEARRDPDVVAVPIGGNAPLRQIALVWRPGSVRGAELRMLGEALRMREEQSARTVHAQQG